MNAGNDAWDKASLEPLPMPVQWAMARPLLGLGSDKHQLAANLAGQGLGMIQKIQPAAKVVKDMIDEGEAECRRLSSPPG